MSPISRIVFVAALAFAATGCAGDCAGDAIGQITTNGVITMFTTGLPANAQPTGITTGPDGNIWFTESNADAIARMQ